MIHEQSDFLNKDAFASLGSKEYRLKENAASIMLRRRFGLYTW